MFDAVMYRKGDTNGDRKEVQSTLLVIGTSSIAMATAQVFFMIIDSLAAHKASVAALTERGIVKGVEPYSR